MMNNIYLQYEIDQNTWGAHTHYLVRKTFSSQNKRFQRLNNKLPTKSFCGDVLKGAERFPDSDVSGILIDHRLSLCMSHLFPQMAAPGFCQLLLPV